MRSVPGKVWRGLRSFVRRIASFAGRLTKKLAVGLGALAAVTAMFVVLDAVIFGKDDGRG